MLPLKSGVVLLVGLAACAPTPAVVLIFPDAASQAQAATFVVAALPETASCPTLMATGAYTAQIQLLTGTFPLSATASLGSVPRGQTVFFAEVRDALARPYLRACVTASAGPEIDLPLQHIDRLPVFSSPGATLEMPEGQTLNVNVVAIDPDGTRVTIAAQDLPDFATFNADAGTLTFAPTATSQGVYPFSLGATEQIPNGQTVTLAVTLTVDDVPRPLRWDRLYRGWHGRFDAAALYDDRLPQLLVSGGRDFGMDLTNDTLFIPSQAPDVLNDYRSLDLEQSPGRWNEDPLIHVSAAGKYGHVMGWVKSSPTYRMGFVLGGSDGAEESPETLLIDPIGRVSSTQSPSSVQGGGGAFVSNMSSAFEPDQSSTYLFGGDISFAVFQNTIQQVTASSQTSLDITMLPFSDPKPPGRSQAAMVLALNPKRLVVIGGRNDETIFNDVWVACLEAAPPKCPQANTWQQLQPTGDTFPGSGAPGVFSLIAGYDPARDRVVTYGGLGVVSSAPWLFEDAFAIDLTAAGPDGGIIGSWTKLPPPGGPLGLVAAAGAYDADGGRMLIYAGVTGRYVNGMGELNITEDVWQLGLSPGTEQLTLLSTTGTAPFPDRRVAPTLTGHGDPLLFGGEGEGTDPVDEWAIHPDAGIEALSLPGISPLPRSDFYSVYNPDSAEFWGYGGRQGNFLPDAALFRFTRDAGFEMYEQSTMQSTVDPRFAQANAYDTTNHRLVIFAGVGVDGLGNSGSLNDVMSATLVNDAIVTTTITPMGVAPSPRYGMVSGYDKARQRMIIFGGTETVAGSELDTSEVWQLSLVAGQEAWQVIAPKGDIPDGMYLPAGVLTKENPPVMYVVGTIARPSGASAHYVDKLWKLTLAPGSETWTLLTLPDFRPRPRVYPATAYDDINNRLILSSGAADPVYRNDVWALTLP